MLENTIKTTARIGGSSELTVTADKRDGSEMRSRLNMTLFGIETVPAARIRHC